jgi:hypothetical protein
MFFRPAFLLAGAGLALAQSLSSQCSSALLAVAASPDATCLDLSLLAPLALSNSSTTSVIPTINTWLPGLCSQGPCTNATLQAVVTNITTGCSSDLASIGLNTTDPTAVATTVETYYPAARQIACLKDTSANSLCVTELLTDIQSATTTLSLSNIVGLITEAISGTTVGIPQNVTCSNCSQAAYTIVAQDFPGLLTSEESTIQSECGSSFTDGQMPSNIQETASNSTSSTGGAASLSVSSLNVGVAMLIAVSSTFAVFA